MDATHDGKEALEERLRTACDDLGLAVEVHGAEIKSWSVTHSSTHVCGLGGSLREACADFTRFNPNLVTAPFVELVGLDKSSPAA